MELLYNKTRIRTPSEQKLKIYEARKEESTMFRFEPERDGVHTEDIHDSVDFTPASLVSLGIGLRAFFSTYRVLEYEPFDSPLFDSSTEKRRKYEEKLCLEDTLYQEKYIQTILHFHHFFELFTKDILRSVDPALALRLDPPKQNNALQLLRMIKGEYHELFSKRTVEFKTSLDRLVSLKGITSFDPLILLLEKKKEVLLLLDELRNRISHKGTYIMRYTALDQIVGQKILPLVNECFETCRCDWGLQEYWKYDDSSMDKEKDPYFRIIETSKQATVKYREIAFYKALGLAMYQNHPSRRRVIGTNSEMKAEILAKYDYLVESYSECMVCGCRSLVLYRENLKGRYFPIGNKDEYRTSKAECEECGLVLYPSLGEPSEYGYSIEELWYDS